MDSEGYVLLKPKFTQPPTPDLRSILEYVDNVFSVIAVMLNTLLIYLIIFHSRKILRPFKPILLRNCIIDFLYTFVNFTTKTHVESKNGWFYGVNTGHFENAKRPWNNCLVFLWIFSVLYATTVVPVPFVYRYYLIVRKHELKAWQYVALMFPSLFVSVTYALLGIYVFWPNPETWNIGAKLISEDPYYYAGIPNFVVANIDTWSLRLLFFYVYIIVFTTYAVTIVTNVKVWKYLNSMKDNMNAHTKEMHRQITKTMTIQATIPFFICMLPIAGCVTTAFLHMNYPGFLMYFSLVWCWVPVANPLLTLYVIRCYRQKVMITITCGQLSGKHTSVWTSSMQIENVMI